MLIRRTLIIRTSLILVLFTTASPNFASWPMPLLFENVTSGSFSMDQANTGKLPENIGSPEIVETLGSETINFQVNAEITYYSFIHFIKNEARQLFISAWNKDKEVKKLSQSTDSLRNAYATAGDEQKEKIASSIIGNEQQLLSLNSEIPSLYEKAREIENQYWLSASSEEKSKFIEKIKNFQDSVQQASQIQNASQNISLPDTITFYQTDSKKETTPEPSSAIVYKIQLASFKTKLPETIAKSLKKLEMLRKVDNYKDEKGVTYYTTGSVKSYQDAVTLQNQVKLEGMKNASIAAFNNGKRITPEEARKLNNEPEIQGTKTK